MRFAVTATGVKSTGGKKLGIFDIAQVRKILEDVKTGEGFAEIENWQRRRLTLTRAEGRWTLQEKKGKAIELFEDELAPWLEAFTTRTADEIMLGQEILPTVSSLTHEQRVAFAGGVAERVLDLYAGVAKPYRSSVEAAIDAVWNATEIGEGNASRLRDLRAKLEDIIAPYAEEPDLGYSALMAISRAVEAAITKDELMVEQAALHARSAVDLTDRGEHGAAMEEDAFQRRWLEVCRRTDPSSLRAAFRNLNTERPGWLERWES